MNVSQLGARVRRRALHRATAQPVGIVEHFTRRRVVGWVSIPAGANPTRVSLWLDDLMVASTYATPDGAMSGVRGGGSTPAPPRGAIRPPKGDRRNSSQQIRTFSFRVAGIWPYVNPRTRITIRVGQHNLPISGHGLFLRRPHKGGHTVQDLRVKLEQGYVLSQIGTVQLSKQLDTAWQRSAMALYTRVRRVLAEAYGYDVFLMYGTLLGAVRDGTYIGHDPDFDAAYVSRSSNGPEAAAELAKIALTLIEHGLSCDLRDRLLHIHDPDDHNFRIDLFHTYFEDGSHRFPWGVAGRSTLLESDWTGTHEIDFSGGRALVPNNAEQLVAHLYGEDWRLPKPGFNWSLDRTALAVDGQLTAAQRSRVYWADFYARTEYTSGSSFFEFVDARSDTPGTVVDIGCGDGRDSCAFGKAGRTVLGLDQSSVGIEHARIHAESFGVDDRVRFRVCDVADVDQLGAALDTVVDATSGPALFYLRFFLHAIPEDVQERLLEAILVHSRPGDLLAAEFRTDKDESNTKVHGKHYRRFQNADQFRESLTTRFGFEVVYDVEDTGLSPYGTEDPVLYRVIARRRPKMGSRESGTARTAPRRR